MTYFLYKRSSCAVKARKVNNKLPLAVNLICKQTLRRYQIHSLYFQLKEATFLAVLKIFDYFTFTM